MLRLAAIVIVVYIISEPLAAFAEEPRARFEVMAGVLPMGCGAGGCGAGFPGFDAGVTGWLLERVGLSLRARGGNVRWLEPSLRLRGFVGENRDREVDFGVGRGVFPDGGYYHSSWKVETLVGFRTRERIGWKVGGELFYAFQNKRHPDDSRGLDAGLLVTVAVIIRPQLGGRQ